MSLLLPSEQLNGRCWALSPAISFNDLGDSVFLHFKWAKALCWMTPLLHCVALGQSHVCAFSTNWTCCCCATLEAHHSIPQSLSPLSAWAVCPALHMGSTRKASSMEEPESCTSQGFCAWRRSCSFTHGWMGNWHCSDSTKNSSSGCHQHTWVGYWGEAESVPLQRASQLCYTQEITLIILLLQFVGLGNSISCLEQTSKRCLWVRTASNATNAFSRILHSCTASSSRWGKRTSVISAPGR